MTITLDMHVNAPQAVEHPFAPREAIVRSNGQVLAYCDTREEAERVKRAFEQVLAPRFTRDEAIALVKTALKTDDYADYPEWLSGVRQTLEALAAAGVFSDAGRFDENHGYSVNERAATARKLDAAGIK